MIDVAGSTGLIGVSRDYFSPALQIEKRRKRSVACRLSKLGYRRCNDDRLPVGLVRECAGTFNAFASGLQNYLHRALALGANVRTFNTFGAKLQKQHQRSRHKFRALPLRFFNNSFCLRVFSRFCSFFSPFSALYIVRALRSPEMRFQKGRNVGGSSRARDSNFTRSRKTLSFVALAILKLMDLNVARPEGENFSANSTRRCVTKINADELQELSRTFTYVSPVEHVLGEPCSQ